MNADRRRRWACVLVVFLPLVILPLGQRGEAAQAPDFSSSREAIEDVIRDYILQHPEVIEQSLQVLEQRRREAEKLRIREAVAARQEELLRDPGSPTGGNPRGDVTVVEFFDYRCRYCKGAAPDVKRLTESDPTVRIVYKVFPILGPDSELAAHAALAAHAQGKFIPFHDALMAAAEPFTLPMMLDLARAAGLDVARLQTDMEAPGTRAAIERNQALARELDITGTPTFIVGFELVPGAVDLHALQALVSQARAR